MNSRSETIHLPYEEVYGPGFEDMVRRVPDVTKLTQLTGYEPKVSLESALTSIIEDQRFRLRQLGVQVCV